MSWWFIATLILFGLFILEVAFRPRSLVRELVGGKKKAERFWLDHLRIKGPTPLSRMPVVAGMAFPAENFKNRALVDIEPGVDPIISLSNYARMHLD